MIDGTVWLMWVILVGLLASIPFTYPPGRIETAARTTHQHKPYMGDQTYREDEDR